MINDRDQSRQYFYEVWQKHKKSTPLQPMELVILSVIMQHQEYSKILDNEARFRSVDFFNKDGEQNPFLHMGLHIALLEQINTDRPAGIASLYRSMLGKCQDEHVLQHQFMACLEKILWQAQHDGCLPDEQEYLDRVRRMTL